MFAIILFILVIFVIALAGVWFWYYKNAPASEEDFYGLAQNAFQGKNYKKAEELLNKFLIDQPNSKEGRELLGETYIELNDYEKAKECYDKVLKAAPKDIQIMAKMAKVLELLQQFDQAKDLYQKAAQENPDSIELNNSIGVVNLKQGNLKEAQEIFEKAIEKNPDDTAAAFYLTKCESEMCDFTNEEKAQIIVERYLMLSKAPDLPKEFDVSLAIAYAKTGQIDKTLAASQRALEADSENIEAYKILGLTQLIKKDLNAAKNTLTTGLHLDSSDKELHELLSYVLCQQKNRCALRECRDKYMDMIGKFLNKNTVNAV